MGLKTIMIGYFNLIAPLLECTLRAILRIVKKSHVIYPEGKPSIPHLPAAEAGSSTCVVNGSR